MHPRLSNPFKRRHYKHNWSGEKWKDIRSIFDVIRDGDLLVHHPYQSFSSSTQRFVEEAARVCSCLLFMKTVSAKSRLIASQSARLSIGARAGTPYAFVLGMCNPCARSSTAALSNHV